MSIIISNNDRAQRLYEGLVDECHIDKEGYSLVIVQHILPNTIPFFKALRARFHITAVIPKPKSIDSSTLAQLENSDPPFPILHCQREQLRDEEYLRRNILEKSEGRKIIFLDIGGYFAGSVDLLHKILGENFGGIVEDTENGHQKYDAFIQKMKNQQKTLPCPIFSVARSPLKEPEDYLVGQSVIYSTERVLREHNTLLTNKIVLVIGYGKIGKSIAGSLAVRNVTVWVYDTNPIRSAQALSHGYHVPERNFGIRNADIIIGASGNHSLKEDDFYQLKPYSFICSVTSADDEFCFGSLRKQIASRDTGMGSEIFYNDKKSFHLLNRGDAINFLHNAILGTYIYLVACELIACTSRIIKNGEYRNDRITTLTTPERQHLAKKWVKEFKNDDI